MKKKTYEFIEKYYESNKDYIYSTLKDAGIIDPKSAFINQVLNRRAYLKSSTKQAIRSVIRSKTFTPQSQIFYENAMSGIRSDKEVYAQFRKIIRHQKIIPENFTYIGDNKYTYETATKIILINFNNSPKAIYLSWIDKERKK